MMAKAFPLLLALIAAIVTLGQGSKKNMWPWIVLYWCVLTVKNVVDMMV